MRLHIWLCCLALWPTLAMALAPALDAPLADIDDTLGWRAFRSFSSADGLPQNSVLALLQDRDGFIIAGTSQGLARYDGHRWMPLELPTAGVRYAVGALGEDSEGALWIGTDAVGAWRIHDSDARPVPIGPNSGVNAFLPTGDGRMWVATFESLYRCRPEHCEAIEVLAGLGARSLLAERIDGEEILWVGTNGSGVVQLVDLDAEQPRLGSLRIGKDDGLPNNIGLALGHFAGDLWIGTGRGLARFDGTRLHVYGKDNGFPVAMVFGLQEASSADGQPMLLASLRTGGVAEINAGGHWRLIDAHHGLPSNAAHALLLERYRRHVWIGTMTSGAARMESDRWALLNERNGLPDRIIEGVGIGSAPAGLWVGTASGAVQWRDGHFVPLIDDPRAAHLVRDVLDAPDGSRWIAHARGLQRWRGNELLDDFTVDNSALPAVSADRLILRRVDNDDFEIHVGTGHGLARWRASDGLRRVDPVTGTKPLKAVRGLATQTLPEAPHRDRLWVATGGQLLRMDAEAWQPVLIDCIGQDSIVDLNVDREQDDGLWVVTRGHLLQMRADGHCTEWPVALRLGALSHVRFHGGNVYVFGSRGMLRLDRTAAPDQSGELLGREAGLDSPEIIDSVIDERGRIFAATASGLAALATDAAQRTTALQPAPLRLLSARHGEGGKPLMRGSHLPPDDSSVAFDFVLLAFDREYAVRYRTHLVGLQPQPGAWTDTADVSYARLPAGTYELIVEARDADGIEAEPIHFPFSVDAPFWQKPSVLLGTPLLLLAVGVLLGRWRLRAARQRAAELEAEVAVRTRELALANQRLEQTALTDSLTGLKNRRYFSSAAAVQAERVRQARDGQVLLVALLDVDHFKRINDSFGHDVGDAVLVEVARRLHALAREGDIVVRWGGEEFLLLLRGVVKGDFESVLRRLLDGIVCEPVRVNDRSHAVAVSIGAAQFPSDFAQAQAESLEQVITRADGALYRAKHEGRRRAIIAEPDGNLSEQAFRTILPSATSAN